MSESVMMNEMDVVPPPETEPSTNKGILRVVEAASALALGGMAAAIQALSSNAAGFTFRLSPATVVAFALGTGGGLLYWKVVAKKSPLAWRLANALLVLAGIGGFLYPLRFVPVSKLSEIAIGLGTAVCALSTIAFILWKMKRFLEADAAQAESSQYK